MKCRIPHSALPIRKRSNHNPNRRGCRALTAPLGGAGRSSVRTRANFFPEAI